MSDHPVSVGSGLVACALVFILAIEYGAATYLVCHDHPNWAAFLFLGPMFTPAREIIHGRRFVDTPAEAKL